MLAKYATIVRRAGALTAVAAAIMVAVSAALVGTKGLIGALVGVARVVLDAIRALTRYLIRRWHVNDEIALFIGTAIVAVLITNNAAVRIPAKAVEDFIGRNTIPAREVRR